jgi:hypothetical protein
MHSYKPGMFSQNKSLNTSNDTTTIRPSQSYAQSARKAHQAGAHTVATPGNDDGMQFTPGRAWTSALPATPASFRTGGFGPPSSQKRAPFSVGKTALTSDLPPAGMFYTSSWRDQEQPAGMFDFMQPPTSTKKAGKVRFENS